MDDKHEIMKNMSKEEKETNTLPCIGVDNKKHICISWENVCLCGVKVLHKNPSIELSSKYYFSCYECTY